LPELTEHWERWKNLFVVEISSRGFEITSGAMPLLELELQMKRPFLESMSDISIQSAIAALVEDTISHAKSHDRLIVSGEDLQYALSKCRVYPFC
jgi:hypothetical protein